ncbi:2Fe-2S iron-sulfur cluster-binding protein, partial [Burkholderia sp. Cy-647]|uniref:2Fe-2S iron-sulfur cluster-binding protein n=1 Tax=Burkholderia sp. Cy-647 TaxID=2608328 RepID=UPI001422F20E
MKITDAPTQRQFRTSSAEDVVSSALAADFPVRFSCREGFCGQCRGEVLAGRYRSGSDGEPREVAP